MQEREAIERAKRGDDVAFEALVRPWLDLAFRTAWLVTRNTSDAEDATQSALIKAHGALDRMRPDAPFRPWFLTIVANEARNQVRSRQRRREAVLPDGSVDRTDPSPLPESIVEAHERRDWILKHLDQLSDTDRLVIHCRYTLDLDEAETAAVLDCARGTVKSRLHRAIARLRQRIESEAETGDLHP